MKLKAVSLVLAATLIFALLAACGGGSAYRDDVSAAELAAAIEKAAKLGGEMIEAPATYVSGTMKLDVAAYADYSIRMNSAGINVDEFGVFKGKDAAQAKEIKAAVEAYLQFRLDTWMPEYMPEERPKLENAQVKVMGNYVAYAILSDAADSAAYGAMESALKK